MKYTLLLAISFFLICCRSGDSQTSQDTAAPAANPIIGKWFWAKKVIISGKDSSVLLSQQVSACEKQSFKEFLSTNTANVEEYSLYSNQCTHTVSSSGSYSYDQTGKKLTINLGSLSNTYNIILLNTSELQLDYGTMDYNNDGVSDKIIYSYSK